MYVYQYLISSGRNEKKTISGKLIQSSISSGHESCRMIEINFWKTHPKKVYQLISKQYWMSFPEIRLVHDPEN